VQREIFIVQYLVIATDRDTTSGELLSGQLDSGRSVVFLLGNFLILFLSNNFNVSRGRHVGVDSTVSTVSTTSHLRGLVTVNVSNDQLLHIDVLRSSGVVMTIFTNLVRERLVIGVRLNVAKKVQEDTSGLLRPADFVTNGLVLLSNGVSANSTSVLGVWDGVLKLKNVLQVALGLLDGSALDSLSNFSAVLEMYSDVTTSGLGDYIISKEQQHNYIKTTIQNKSELKC
jgi:hypothetical protein